jgi:hypothetical protein
VQSRPVEDHADNPLLLDRLFRRRDDSHRGTVTVGAQLQVD